MVGTIWVQRARGRVLVSPVNGLVRVNRSRFLRIFAERAAALEIHELPAVRATGGALRSVAATRLGGELWAHVVQRW